jgi:hypothetical protein
LDKHELFQRTASLWPDAIVLSGASGDLETLNAIYWPLEKHLASSSDDWAQLAAWAFHQALAQLAATKLASGKTSLRPEEIPFETFDRWIRMNLLDESWSGVRKEYDPDLE